MSRTYSGWHARWYNRIWRRFERCTLAAALALTDWEALAAARTRRGEPPCILDVACGTGLLLRRLRARLPDAEVCGVDASADMLAQARALLSDSPHVHLLQVCVGASPQADLPVPPHTFDLVTCTNAMSYFPDPAGILGGLAQLMTPDGQLVLVDYARRPVPFPWPIFAWLVRRLDPGHVRAYTLREVRELCRRAGLRVTADHSFSIDWLWHGCGVRGRVVSPGDVSPSSRATALGDLADVADDIVDSVQKEHIL